MQDSFGRIIDYLRISITDRCNFRCSYCMPPEGVPLLEHSEILSYEELLRVIRILGQYGVNKIRITGGEPLIRKGILDFIRAIREIETVTDLAMTTNGSLLADRAYQLKKAGLDRVNISIDTLNPKEFSRITGGGQLSDVLQGIESAMNAGLTPVKLNVVVTEVFSMEDLSYFIKQTYEFPIAVRFIEYMPVGRCGVKAGYSIKAIKNSINTAGYGMLEKAFSIKGNGPAHYYRLPRAMGVFGFITPMTEHFCHTCNRIRLTADGKIKPCLLANKEFDIKHALRSGTSDSKVAELFIKALQGKPLHHIWGNEREGTNLIRNMSQVGG
ncbi:GTP 3',8-cyclase MoaA [Pelosinus fermentans]|uniref:GTP 3',8-cyclase n=1 Tax=Pelosinus fermentans JBW45 TaxID=1192197 RepID=I9NTD5_9FIRM|nr:GTP 3',8-cyclase MoaA [Pelosinus fermentans]AJQ26431.1 molybdenum cofactor biosynthesis protein A [Pelosinus fermentans JBW45]